MSVNIYDAANDELIPVAGETLYADTPIGVIQAFDAEEVPDSWLIFNGQTVNRADYPELWARANRNGQVGADKFYGIGDGGTTFTLADLRETSLKGYGETSRSVGAHVKSGGLAVGEFIDDRIQNHKHNLNSAYSSELGSILSVVMRNRDITKLELPTQTIDSGRNGATTEVKAVGVVWAVKAKQVGLPIDLQEQMESYITQSTEPVKLVEQGVGSTSAINVNWTESLSNFRFIIVEVRTTGICRGSMLFVNRKQAYLYLAPFYYSGSVHEADFNVNANQTSGSIQIPNVPSAGVTVFIYGIK